MLRKVLFFLLIVPFTMTAQDFVELETTTSSDKKTVLIIPFNSEMYQNKEGEFIGKASNMNYEQSVNYFKQSLDSALLKAMKDSCRAISLLNSYTQGISTDLIEVHTASNYYMSDRPAALESKKSNELFNKFNFKKKKNKDLEELEQKHQGEVVSVREDLSKKFMNVRFSEKDVINNLTLKYGAKYLVFITEFDLVADYSNPYTVADKTYTRTIKVHYTIFSSEGKFIYGNYETVEFPASNDNISDICTNNLPIVVKKIARKIP